MPLRAATAAAAAAAGGTSAAAAGSSAVTAAAAAAAAVVRCVDAEPDKETGCLRQAEHAGRLPTGQYLRDGAAMAARRRYVVRASGGDVAGWLAGWLRRARGGRGGGVPPL
ncbi:hypothetical protein COO60DRAFT_1643659 [Scenedesmus sp. NREL 46B-D3]|nr:hypothetical protein COO60DRAFT_1643659 [Scenedesmus sp. NREL 46B-D3]